MKKTIFVVLVAVFALSVCSFAQDKAPAAASQETISVPVPQPAAPQSDTLPTLKDKVSYAIGLDIGSSLKGQSIDVDSDILIKGINDALSGAKPLLSREQIQEAMMTFQKEHAAEMLAKQKKVAAENAAEGAAFLAENAKKPGVITLPSGLQYKVLTKGTGESPSINDKVTVNYEGTLIDGTVFDSSYKRGKPITFPVGAVIKGWTEALQKMKVGSKWRLFVPAELAYGSQNRGPIAPGSTLIFDVELISIEKDAPKQPAAAPSTGKPAAGSEAK